MDKNGIFGDLLIRALIDAGGVENVREDCIGPCSLDLRVGDSVAIISYGQSPITLGKPIEYSSINVDETIKMYPGDFLLATTQEYFKLPADVGCVIKGRSSIGRAGLCVQNAGYVDAGFEGEITLELYNQGNQVIEIPVGYRIAQAVFFPVVECSRGYNGKYSAQTGATGSRAHLDEEKKHE